MLLIERLAILALLGASLWVAARWLERRWRLASPGDLPGLESLARGKVGLLCFTAPDCAPCQTVQEPALQTLKAEMGDTLQVILIDALARPDLADHWGVLSVPTTFVIDREGRVRGVNHGAARAGRLRSLIRRSQDLPAGADLSEARAGD